MTRKRELKLGEAATTIQFIRTRLFIGNNFIFPHYNKFATFIDRNYVCAYTYGDQTEWTKINNETCIRCDMMGNIDKQLNWNFNQNTLFRPYSILVRNDESFNRQQQRRIEKNAQGKKIELVIPLHEERLKANTLRERWDNVAII